MPTTFARTRPPWLALVLCLMLTAAATAIVARSEREAGAARYANEVAFTRGRIEQRMAVYTALLRGCAGLFSRPELVSEEEFRAFVERLRLRTDYPGTQGLGFSERFATSSTREAAERARVRGRSGLQVWPDTPRDEINAIVLIEPMDDRNRAALGFDMATETTRREAMERARDLGTVALSGKVILVQEIEETKQPGFLLYAPVYESGSVPRTMDQRRATLKGYTYAALRARDMFEGIFGRETPSVSFELYDGDAATPESLLHVHGSPMDQHEVALVERLSIAGRVWTARFARSSSAPQASLVPVVALLGVGLSIVVFLVTRSRESSRLRELRATASALEANQDVLRFTETFIGVLGHDLRNPLNAITLTAHALLERDGTDAQTKKTVSRIVSSSDRMARMIDQILDFTRSRIGGGIPVASRRINLGALVHDVVDELTVSEESAAVETATRGDLDGEWDPDRLAQVFSNLVGNAVAHAEGRPVEITISGEDRATVVATVHNAGVIPASFLPVAFEPFQGSTTHKRSRAGLGLGLYITREIVAAHKGTIDVVSTEDAGTTFTVSLPRHPQRS